VWALVENLLCGFPSSGGRRFSVHGCVSVHAVVELRADARELHHLTGHYRRAVINSPRCATSKHLIGQSVIGRLESSDVQ
jgi:hypothetical protein